MKNLAVEFDGTPCAVKAACTVWSGGKSGDNIKGLPIAIRRKIPGNETAYGRRWSGTDRNDSGSVTGWSILKNQ